MTAEVTGGAAASGLPILSDPTKPSEAAATRSGQGATHTASLCTHCEDPLHEEDSSLGDAAAYGLPW